jgi:tetratricopeptide (TPR) repeat protein
MSYIKKFNPYDLTEETLLAIATGREQVLKDILATIARNAEGGGVQHLQVVAPRGYGKSFLMRLVQSALKARVAEGLPAVLALLPEEQNNVDAPHQLLREIQRVLEGRPVDSLLGGAFAESDGAWEAAVAALEASIAAKLPEGRGVAVAIVENFDQLISDVFRKPRDQSRLRELLTRPGGRLMLLATATHSADAVYEQRLFQATRLIPLDPWKEESCLAFFEKLRGHRQAGPMSPQTRGKARAIAQFIGGSPRMATVLAEVLDTNDSLRAAQMLDALVDELTPYYKHRIESLARRSRTLLDALLRMGEPRSQSELAAQLGVTQARIAEPFNELRARGEVVGVKAQHSAEMLYRVSDRLMAHYYRKRYLFPGAGASLLEHIIEFLELYYTVEEMRVEAERLRARGLNADASVMERLAAKNSSRPNSGRLGPVSEDGWLKQLRERVVTLVDAGQSDEAIALCQQAMERADSSGDWRGQVHSRRYLGWSLIKIGRSSDAEELFRRALAFAEQAGDLREQVVMSMRLGWVLGELGRHAEAEETLRRAIALAEESGSRSVQAEASRQLGWVLGELGRHKEAEETLRRAIALAEESGDLTEQAESSRLLGWVLGELGRHKEAEETLRRAIALAEQIGALIEQAEASRHLGGVLRGLDRHVEAEEMLRRALSLAERTGDAAIVACAAVEYLELGRLTRNDAGVVMAWQRATASVAVAPAISNLPDIAFWFDDAAIAALRSMQFGEFWGTAAALPVGEMRLHLAQRGIARSIAEINQTQGRAAAYALVAHAVDVLAQDAAARAKHGSQKGPEPITFLCGILSGLSYRKDEPALLRDIIALLEQRLPSETEAQRKLLAAAALRAENPGNPASLERVDPDVARLFDLIADSTPETASEPPPRSSSRRGKRSGTSRRKK